MNTNEISAERVQELVNSLLDREGTTPQTVAEELEHRVSARTIYRWAKGESIPGNTFDYEALVSLAKAKGV